MAQKNGTNGHAPHIPQPPTPDLDLDNLVDSKEAAKILKLGHLKVLHRWRANGKVRGFRRQGRWFYSRTELLRMFVPSQPAASMPPTQAERERRAAEATESLRAKGWVYTEEQEEAERKRIARRKEKQAKEDVERANVPPQAGKAGA
jgi:hypothetical protein